MKSFSNIFKNNLNTFGPRYNRIDFSNKLKNNGDKSQVGLMEYFETFEYINGIENYNFDKNTKFSIITLKQSNFDSGTVRITKPGIYILKENITFNPNEQNDFFPTYSQIQSKQYPIGKDGPYHLGFFAAITIEASNVILDLNGYTIKQSKLHNLQQRFYSHIELANSPFIPKQGPGSFVSSNTFKSAKNILIRNGILGKSSHHGIHGNANNNIIINNLEITDFEVAGIALNGTNLGILNNINIHDSSKNVPVLATYSAARFIRSFIPLIKKNHKEPFINIQGVRKNYVDIVSDLNEALEITKNSIMENNTTDDVLFKTRFNMSDGNVYGLLLHINGVAVNGFVRTRNENMIGNKDILLQDINIGNISSHPIEVIGVNTHNNEPSAYGKNMQVGPVGEVMRIEDIVAQDGTYKPNPLSNAHMLIAKYNTPKIGTTNICKEIVEFVEMDSNFKDTMVNNKLYYVNGGDSMAHVMKGNMGMFISGGINIKGYGINVSNIYNKGTHVGTSPLIEKDLIKMKSSTCNGILFTGSSDIDLKCDISNIQSESGENYSFYLYNINSENIKINGSNIVKDE